MQGDPRPCRKSERADWLRLIRSENVGPATFWSLLSRYGTAAAALDAMPELAKRGGRRGPLRIASADVAGREVAVADTIGARHLFFGMADYPRALQAISAPPPVVMVRGDATCLSRRCLAIVGSRKASAAGRTMARRLSEAFTEAGFVVVSGLALGIDAEAHRAALPVTAAVVAGGVDKPTPEDNLDLADEIIDGGALLSEMPLGLVPYSRDYPRRNRLIAGLCEAVVIVEAAVRSGSLHTARYAADAGRDVFAVPGSPLDPRAAGCLSLLREGAGLVVDASDVLSTLRDEVTAPTLPGLAEGASNTFAEPAPADVSARVASLLSVTPIGVDEVVRACGAPAGVVMGALLELEMGGRAVREADGRVRAGVEDA